MNIDDFDIYNDLDAFQNEEEKKSAELVALESKYNDSLKEVEALQLDNADLRKKIKRIEVNFQNLLDTAKAEIKRKDKHLEELRKEKDDICFRRKLPRRNYGDINALPWSNNEAIDRLQNCRREADYRVGDNNIQEVRLTELFNGENTSQTSNTKQVTDMCRSVRIREENDASARTNELSRLQYESGTVREKYERTYYHKDEHKFKVQSEIRCVDDNELSIYKEYRQLRHRAKDRVGGIERESRNKRTYSPVRQEDSFKSKRDGNGKHQEYTKRKRDEAGHYKTSHRSRSKHREDSCERKKNPHSHHSASREIRDAKGHSKNKHPAKQAFENDVSKGVNKSDRVNQCDVNTLKTKSTEDSKEKNATTASSDANKNDCHDKRKRDEGNSKYLQANTNEISVDLEHKSTVPDTMTKAKPSIYSETDKSDFNTPKKALFDKLFGRTPSAVKVVDSSMENSAMTSLVVGIKGDQGAFVNYNGISGQNRTSADQKSQFDECFVPNKVDKQKLPKYDEIDSTEVSDRKNVKEVSIPGLGDAFIKNIPLPEESLESEPKAKVSENVAKATLGNEESLDVQSSAVILISDDEINEESPLVSSRKLNVSAKSVAETKDVKGQKEIVHDVGNSISGTDICYGLTCDENVGNKKDIIKSLENVPVLNVYQLRAQQRRMRLDLHHSGKSEKNAKISKPKDALLNVRPLETNSNKVLEIATHAADNTESIILKWCKSLNETEKNGKLSDTEFEKKKDATFIETDDHAKDRNSGQTQLNSGTSSSSLPKDDLKTFDAIDIEKSSQEVISTVVKDITTNEMKNVETVKAAQPVIDNASLVDVDQEVIEPMIVDKGTHVPSYKCGNTNDLELEFIEAKEHKSEATTTFCQSLTQHHKMQSNSDESVAANISIPVCTASGNNRKNADEKDKNNISTATQLASRETSLEFKKNHITANDGNITRVVFDNRTAVEAKKEISAEHLHESVADNKRIEEEHVQQKTTTESCTKLLINKEPTLKLEDKALKGIEMKLNSANDVIKDSLEEVLTESKRKPSAEDSSQTAESYGLNGHLMPKTNTPLTQLQSNKTEITGGFNSINCGSIKNSHLPTTKNNALIDKIKCAEIVWKYRIPKLSDQRKSDNAENASSKEEGSAITNRSDESSVREECQSKPRNKEYPTVKKDTVNQARISDKEADKRTIDNLNQKDLIAILDKELIEAPLLIARSVEDKEALAANQEKSERIIKEIDNWARRKVGRTAELQENKVLLNVVGTKQELKDEIVIESVAGSVTSEGRGIFKGHKRNKMVTEKVNAKPLAKTQLQSAGKMGINNASNIVQNGLKEDTGKCEQLPLICQPNKAGNKDAKEIGDDQIENAQSGQKCVTIEHKREESTQGKVIQMPDIKSLPKEGSSEENGAFSRKQETGGAAANQRNQMSAIAKEVVANEDGNVVEIRSQVDKAKHSEARVKCVVTGGISDSTERKEQRKDISIESKAENVDNAQIVTTQNKQNKNKLKNTHLKRTEKKVEVEESVENRRHEVISDIPTVTEVCDIHSEPKEGFKSTPLRKKALRNRDEPSLLGVMPLKRKLEAAVPEKRTKLAVTVREDHAGVKISTEKSATNAAKQKQVPITKCINILSVSEPPKALGTIEKAVASHSDTVATVLPVESSEIVVAKRKRRRPSVSSCDEMEITVKPGKRRRCKMLIEDTTDDECAGAEVVTQIGVNGRNSRGTCELVDILLGDTTKEVTPEKRYVNRKLNEPQTPSLLPADISPDEQYREIDSRLQLLFASPKLPPEIIPIISPISVQPPDEISLSTTMPQSDETAATPVSLPTPLNDGSRVSPMHNIDFNVSATFISDIGGNSPQANNADLTVDETNHGEMLPSSSFNCDDGNVSTKHISLGASDYRFEKVSDNVVNVFVTRKRRGKRKETATASTT